MTTEILLIESSKERALFYQNRISKNPYFSYPLNITTAPTLKMALELIERQKFQLILLNLELKDSKGLETLILIYQLTSTTPLVVIELEDEKKALDAIKFGAQDCVSFNEAKTPHFDRVLLFSMEREKIIEELHDLSFTDELTQVYNRRGILTLAQQQMEISKRQNKGFSLLLADLDNLKGINDKFGHLEGDIALLAMVECITKTVRASDIVGRLGGDEFVILAITANEEEGLALARTLAETSHHYNVEPIHPYKVTFSLGFAYFDPASPKTFEELIAVADKQLYENKRLLFRR